MKKPLFPNTPFKCKRRTAVPEGDDFDVKVQRNEGFIDEYLRVLKVDTLYTGLTVGKNTSQGLESSKQKTVHVPDMPILRLICLEICLELLF